MHWSGAKPGKTQNKIWFDLKLSSHQDIKSQQTCRHCLVIVKGANARYLNLPCVTL